MQAGPSTHYRRSWQPNGRPAPAAESEYDSDASSSSEDVTEDEEGMDLTPALDAAILRTLGKIRRGDGVYEGEKVLEQELEQATAEAVRRGVKARPVNRSEAKPFLLADHHRTNLLEGRDLAQEEEDQAWEAPPTPYAQEQRRMRKEAIDAFHTAVEEDEGEFEPVTKGKHGAAEGEKEDEEYKKFLLEMGGGEEEVRKLLGMGDSGVSFVRADANGDGDGDEISGLEASGKTGKKKGEKKRKGDTEKKAKADDEFLMNYILNRGWLEKDEGGRATSLDLAVDQNGAEDDEDESSQAGPSHPWGLLDEDEFDDKADEFEAEYNFRFEEPDSSSIHTHPRQIESLVRRPDDARKNKRQERAERKAAEQAAKEEEARKTKGKKRREMDGQLAALRKEVGEKEWAKVEEVLEGEFEEGVWERVIGGLLEGLEAGGGAAEDNDDEKPTWDDEDDGYGDYDAEEDLDGDMAQKEDVDVEPYAGQDYGPIDMDADFVGLEPGKKKRKKDKKGKRREQEEELEAEQPLSVKDRADKVKQAMEEYKALDHEDMIGDLPTRFHYTKSAPLAYGLTPAEILLASDAELNQIMSVKHIAPYRSGGLGMAGKGLSKRVRDLKDSLKERRWGEEYVPPKESKEERYRDKGWPKREIGAEGQGGEVRKKRAGKNERKRKAAAENIELGGSGIAGQNGSGYAASIDQPKSAQQATAPYETGLASQTGEDGETGGAKKRRKKRKHGAAAAA